MIAAGAWLGVLGGGQLARMFAAAAHRLGFRVAAVDPDPGCPAAGVVDRLICEALDNPAAWRELARNCAAVTIETENVPVHALRYLARHVTVVPGARPLAITQDRAAEKQFLASNHLPVTDFRIIESPGQALAPGIQALLPGVLKASQFGYDGKGQISIASRAQLVNAVAKVGGPCILEKRVALAAELSVILARSADGATMVHPIPMNTHCTGILDVSVVPAPIPVKIRRQAIALALRIASLLRYRGVLCVEFFITEAGTLLVNEIAPRPHNSGHFTIDACVTSQFEQQVRVLAGLPLGATGLINPRRGIAMVNLLGDLWANHEPNWRKVLMHPRARLHLYGKQFPRPGRKMGHITCFANSVESASEAAISIRAALSVKRP